VTRSVLLVRTPSTRFTQTADGSSVAYQVWGEGPPNITWFPFIWGHLEIQWEEPGFRAALERFGSMGRAAQFDKRGAGLSDPLERAATLDDRMDDARAVLDAAGMDRVYLGGLSEGGPLAILFAATYPERVDGLILINTFAGPVPGIPEELHRAFIDEQVAVWETFLERWGDPASPIVEAFIPSRADDQAFRRWVARYTTNAMRPAAVRAAMEMTRAMNVASLLPTIQVPTLVIHVTGDRVIPSIAGKALARAIPNARFEAFEGDDHMYACGDLRDPIIDCIEDFINGSHVRASSPGRALATVLFTDIVDSTAIASRVGDAAWRQMLDAHDELVAEVVQIHGGRRVKSTGDGVLATFESPSRAIECACSLRDRVPRVGLELRVGLHTGEIEIRGDDVGGIAVHIASRVETCARPGEVVVSRTLRDLVVGSNFRFEDRGAHDLRGVAGAWELSVVL
jgi:class 3 adenylate cyclase/pimeloyl-ACP methyl ester carboxylesterase